LSQNWSFRPVPVKIRLGDKTLLAPELWLQVREVSLDDEAPPVTEPEPPTEALQANSQGFLVRSLGVVGKQPVLRRQHGYLCYVSSQYPRYYIDMRQSFDEYKNKFSSKTRSTLNRKMRKYAEYCGGEIFWRTYTTPDEMHEFYGLARAVSRITYQEKLLDAGLPESREFRDEMGQRAQQGQVRGFILFHQNRPVSYLYCPINNGVLIYAFLGYDPDYMNYSVGTVLQWLALQHLFEERCFRFFDFTEGQSEHKKLFATHSVQSANVFFLRSSLPNSLLVHAQKALDDFSKTVGGMLQWLGIKTMVKKWIRASG
jgi:CelD/BcsL family acetyltransferase involved in cellulose biosynthesis